MALSLKDDICQYLAWKSIQEDSESLNLDAYQNRQVSENLERRDKIVNMRLNEAYCWLLVPTQEDNQICLTTIPVASSNENYIIKASKKLKESELLITTRWSPALLKIELDRWFWKDQLYISVKKLWADLCSYPYLSRLKDSEVLLNAIRDGIRSKDYFGYAASLDDNGRYLGLTFNSNFTSISIDSRCVIIKKEVAQKQLADEKVVTSRNQSFSHPNDLQASDLMESALEEEKKQPSRQLIKRFFGTIDLDSTRLGRDAGMVAEEVVQLLKGLIGCNVEVTLEISAEFEENVPDNIVRTITENCKELKFKQYNFEE